MNLTQEKYKKNGWSFKIYERRGGKKSLSVELDFKLQYTEKQASGENLNNADSGEAFQVI